MKGMGEHSRIQMKISAKSQERVMFNTGTTSSMRNILVKNAGFISERHLYIVCVRDSIETLI